MPSRGNVARSTPQDELYKVFPRTAYQQLPKDDAQRLPITMRQNVDPLFSRRDHHQGKRYHEIDPDLDPNATDTQGHDMKGNSTPKNWDQSQHLAVTEPRYSSGPAKGSQESPCETIELDFIHAPNDGPSLAVNPPLYKTTKREQGLQRIPTRRYKLTFSLWVLHLLLPVGISFAILQLAFRNHYWRNAQIQGTSEILGVFQIVAKAHEILIVYSLSRIVLYYLRVLLGTSSGLPLGLFASSYGQYLGKFPTEFSFWSSLVSTFWSRDFQWRSFLFAMLVILTALIGLVAGPASAIAIIPQLRWWHWSDLFAIIDSAACTGFSYTVPRYLPRGVSLYVAKPLFPLEVDVTSLPGLFCLNASLDGASVCPYHGLDVFPTRLSWTDGSNFTIGTTVGRVVASEYSLYQDQNSTDEGSKTFTARVWTTNELLTKLLSLGLWSPSTAVEAQVFQSRSVPSPLVDVHCHVRPSTDFVRNLSSNESFDIRKIWDEGTLSNPQTTHVEWREFPDKNGHPSLVGFILTQEDTQGHGNVSVWSVQAQWISSDLYLLPSQSPNAISNFSFNVYQNYSGLYMLSFLQPTLSLSSITAILVISSFNWLITTEAALNFLWGDSSEHILEGYRSQINVRKAWADALNAFNSTVNSTTLATFVDASMKQYRPLISNSSSEDDNDLSSGSYYPANGHSLVLSTAIAHGLASIGLGFEQNITYCRGGRCSEGPYFTGDAQNYIFNGTREEWHNSCPEMTDRLFPQNMINSSQIFQSFKEPSKSFKDSQWTEISYPIFRYGYGWSLNSSTVKAATAILLLHALVVIVHVCYVLFSGLSYTYAESIAELLVLALESKPPQIFNTSRNLPKFHDRVWTRPTMVRQVRTSEDEGQDRLELVLDGGLKYRRVLKEEDVAEDDDI